MPKGSVADAFADRYGAAGGVKMSYLGKDKFGNPIYKFTYQVNKTAGAIAAGRGKVAPNTKVTTSRTLAIVRNGSSFEFVAPGSSQANPSQITNPEEVKFKQGNNEMVDRGLAKVGELLSAGAISTETARLLAKAVPNMGETALKNLINRRADVYQNYVGGPWYDVGDGMVQEVAPVGSAQDNLDDLFSGIDFGGGGGGGGGFAGPVYRAPDRRVVEDFVKGTLVSLVGNVPEEMIGPLADTYMQDHRRNFDSATAEIDPQMSVVEAIRNTAQYQAIHKLRPKSVDERDWISQRAQEAQRGGLDTAKIEDFAIMQATAGADLPDVAEAAATSQFQSSGQAPTILDQKFRQVAQGIFSRAVAR